MPPSLYSLIAAAAESSLSTTRATRPLNPQSTSTDVNTIAIPTLMNPAITKLSCHGCALRPGAVIGDRAPVPNTAASDVTTQFIYVP
jgi:hypothetical protein